MDARYDAEALRLARQASAPGESVLWAGRPGRRWVPNWEVIHPAALFATVAGAILWNVRDDWGRLADKWWLALVLLIPAAPLAFAVWSLLKRDQVVYAVSDRRVLILRRDGTVRHAAGLERAGEFRLQGRTLSLGGEDEAVRLGKRDLDGGLQRFDLLPRLERLAEPERVMAVIRAAAPRA